MAELKRDVLARIASPGLRVYTVWVPIMAEDSADTARAAAARLDDPRVSHFWDEGGALSRAMGSALRLPGTRGDSGVAWDIYLLYPPGPHWSDPAPRPAFWMHQLMGVDPHQARFFEGAVFAKEVLARLPGTAG